MRWIKKIPVWILAVCALLLFCGFDENGQKVYDNANLFTDAEEEALQEQCVEMARQEELDVVIYTTNSMGGMDDVDYAEKIYRQYGFGYEKEGGAGILLLIDMGSRVVYIHENQLEENPFLFLDSELDVMIDRVASYLSEEQYFSAAQRFIRMVAEYADPEDVDDDKAYDGSGDGEYDVDGNYTGRKPYTFGTFLIQMLVAMIIAGIAVSVMHFKQKTSKVTDGRVYLKDHRFQVRERSDVFTHTTVTKHRIQRDEGGSGGGSHSSHHGGSHSGGGSHSHGRGGSF